MTAAHRLIGGQRERGGLIREADVDAAASFGQHRGRIQQMMAEANSRILTLRLQHQTRGARDRSRLRALRQAFQTRALADQNLRIEIRRWY